MNTPLPIEKFKEIQSLVQRNQKIEAIKLYRECTNTGLSEAKMFIEDLEAELRGEPRPPARPGPSDASQSVNELLFQGRKIEAIKRYREDTGKGLAEAKTEVEAMEAELRATNPERFTKPAGKGGCMGLLLIVGTILSALVLLIVLAVIRS
ncbi:MAG: hypothetical protein WCO56_27970 [Verrucomicrobiota bacterium]